MSIRERAFLLNAAGLAANAAVMVIAASRGDLAVALICALAAALHSHFLHRLLQRP